MPDAPTTQAPADPGKIEPTNDPQVDPQALPCPFCGSAAEAELWHGGSPTKTMIRCSSVGCLVDPSATAETHAEALRLWNTRAVLSSPAPAAGTMEEVAALAPSAQADVAGKLTPQRVFAWAKEQITAQRTRAETAEATADRLRVEHAVLLAKIEPYLIAIERQVQITCDFDRNETAAKKADPVATTVEISLSHVTDAVARIRTLLSNQKADR